MSKMKIDLSGLKFDYLKFMSMPRCSMRFYESGAGCSLTAFWYALGFQPVIAQAVNQYSRHDFIRFKGFKSDFLLFLHKDFGMVMLEDLTEATNTLYNSKDSNFAAKITQFHDEGKEATAVHLLLELVKVKLSHTEVPVEIRELCHA